MWLTQSITAPNYLVQILYVLLGSLLVSIGIIFEVTPKLLYLAGDGLMITVARVLNRPFGQIKVVFDITLVSFSIKHIRRAGYRCNSKITANCKRYT